MKCFILLIVFVIHSNASTDECAGVGQPCGGPNGTFCCITDDVLRCRQPANSTDASAVGTCVKTCKQEGEMCGGFAGFRCCSGQGLKCDAPKKCCDFAGKCVKQT